MVCDLVFSKHQALKVHDLDVAAVEVGFHVRQVVGIVAQFPGLEHSRLIRPRATAGPALVEIWRPQQALAHSSFLVAFAVVFEVLVIVVDWVPLLAAHRVFAVVLV